MAIKWRDKDQKKLVTYVRKFNAGITRLEKSNPDIYGILPERINVQEARQSFTTRADFNRFLKKIDRFFKPKARDVIQSSSGPALRWQVKEEKLIERRLNKIRKNIVKEFNVTYDQQEYLNLRPVDFEQKKQEELSKGRADKWFNFLYQAERESADRYYDKIFSGVYSQYKNALREQIGGDIAEDIIRYIDENKIYGTDILWAIGQDDGIGFEYMYSLEQRQAKGENILERWKSIMPTVKAQRRYQERIGRKEKNESDS